MKTRAAVLHQTGFAAPYAASRPLVVEELDLDGPGPDEVLVRIRAAGLCHSDLSVINGDRPRPVPMALGHEAAGEVLECGPGVRDLAPGDRVVMVFRAELRRLCSVLGRPPGPLRSRRRPRIPAARCSAATAGCTSTVAMCIIISACRHSPSTPWCRAAR